MTKWRWLDWPPYRWSRPEQDAVSQLGLTAGTVFVLLTIPQFVFLRTPIWNSGFVALLTTVLTVIGSLLVARPICNALWPDLIRAGDENAAERLAREDNQE
jgi:hypothetical protein